MLNLNIKVNNTTRNEYLNLDDFYVNPDLSMISGTTERIQNLSVNDEFWISSQYLPSDKRVELDFLTSVVRNGYVLYKEELEINTLYYHNEAQQIDVPAYYVEMDGVVYYEKDGRFNINGDFIEMTENQSKISILKKIYVENHRITINGEVYIVTINSNGVFICDTLGDRCPYTLNTSHVVQKPTEVYKIGFKNDPEKRIDVKDITKFGYIPYIIYDDSRVYFQKLIDSEGYFEGFGVRINDTNYIFDDSTSGMTRLSVSNPDNYQMFEFDGDLGLDIEGVSYKIYFDMQDVEDGEFICIETKETNQHVTVGDTITLKSIHYTNVIDVLGEDSEHKYTFINGIRYNSIKNLCDTITVGDKEYQLHYQGDASNPYIGMLATIDYGDDTETFRVSSLNASGTEVTELVKVKYYDGKWNDAYTINKNRAGETEYVKANNYTIRHNDGFDIDGIEYPIIKSDIFDGEGFVIETKDVVEINKPVEYELKVTSLVGANKIICTVDLDQELVQEEDFYNQRNIIFSALVNNDEFVMYKRGSMFGTKTLYAKKWLKEAIEAPNPSSTYTLSQSYQRIRPYRRNDAISVPLVLSSDLNNDLLREDLLRNYYCSEKEELALNKIVDLEKDIYTPVTSNGEDITTIEFNLHFRTRDTSKYNGWARIEDRGQNWAGDENSNNNLYSNWFITDCWPYNKEIRDGKINDVMRMSDLLGLMFFTTDDVKSKREKLSGSFLRLTYFDSRDPQKQNMLGTSTVYLDCDKLYNTISKNEKKGENSYIVEIGENDTEVIIPTNNNNYVSYNDVVMTTEDIAVVTGSSANVTVYNEAFISGETGMKLSYDDTDRLSSRLTISDRYDTTHSSEGFYSYLLKNIANKRKKQTVYLKAEFFHAGLGIKIPMSIPTDGNKNAISNWNTSLLENLKKGYKSDEIHLRQYIPIDISYSLDRREFVYEISSDHNFKNAIFKNENGTNKLIFNLFELKVTD